jgi:hypothetical protein
MAALPQFGAVNRSNYFLGFYYFYSVPPAEEEEDATLIIRERQIHQVMQCSMRHVKL